MQADPVDVAQGDAGVALLCGYVDACFPGRGWDRAAHGLLDAAARRVEHADVLSCGLFSGLAGLAFVAWCLSRGGVRYQRFLRSVEDALLLQAARLSQRLQECDSGVPVGAIDVISGLSGIGVYLLCRRERPEVEAALASVLDTLVALTRSCRGLPAWYTPPELTVDRTMAARHPSGTMNCGLAHGIPGPLALMALALAEGFDVPGQADAVRETAAWLASHRSDDVWGVNWSSVLPVEMDVTGNRTRPSPEPSRAAWCYGSPGVARALWHASCALNDPALMELAISAMQAVFRRPIPLRRIDSPTFCHGIAGLLQITLRFGNDTGMPVFAEAAGELLAQLLAAYEPDGLLGYRDLEPGGNLVDRPGLLDGAAGVAIVLLAASTNVEPTWDRLFLLS